MPGERTTPRRILFVADLFPWPSTKGGLIRVATAVEALTQLGEVDLFSLYDTRGPTPELPPDIGLARWTTSAYPDDAASHRWKVEWPLRRGTPLSIARRSADPRPRHQFLEFAHSPYDLVWFSTAATWVWMGRPRLGPTIIDLIDLEDVKERQNAARIHTQPARGGRALAVRTLKEGKARVDAIDWARLQASAADAADHVVLCSPVDTARFGAPNTVTVPNTYPLPSRPVGSVDVGHPPTIVFPGSFDYAPNAQGARWLVESIAPELWRLAPDAEFRLVGKATPEVAAFDDVPGVTVTDLVPAMEEELAKADLILVPLRAGSGTRLKILEAFAHRIPVVSTAIGAEGIGAVDEIHLRLAETPRALAEACRELLSNPELRARLTDAAHALYLERFQSSVAHQLICDLAESAMARHSHPPSESGDSVLP